MNIRSAVLPLLLLLSACSVHQARQTAGGHGDADRGAIRITVFHVNDVHGWIMARDAGKLDAANPKRKVGGFAALANAVRAEKGPKLLIDGGDWFQGTPEGGMTEGRAPVDLMGAVGFDATVVGNHEFDFAEATLKTLAARARIPVLAANIYDEATGNRVPYVKPHIVKEVAGVKVGLFGLLTTKMNKLTFAKNYKGLRFRDESDEAAEQVAALKAEGADVIIAVTHVGIQREGMEPFEDDRAIAAAVPGIDLIVGGHTHTPLFEPVREATHGTTIVQAGHYLQRVGKVVLEIDPATKRVVKTSGGLETLWIDRFGEAPDILERVKGFQAEVGKELDVVIGTATAAFFRSQTEESAMGDWMTDCLRDHTHTEAAFQNAGGIRSELAAGPVTLRHIYEVMPFDNRVVTLTLKGEHLHDVLENGVSGAHGLLQMSGTQVLYDPQAPSGSRVVEEKVGSEPLDRARDYAVAASDFMVMGGDGYGAFSKASQKEEKEDLLRDVLVACVKKTGSLTPPPLGRINKK